MAISHLDDYLWELWHRVSQPHAKITDPTERLYARALMVVCLLFIPIPILHNFLFYFVGSPFNNLPVKRFEVSLLGMAFPILIYFLSYQGKTQTAARLAMLLSSIIILLGFAVTIPTKPDYQIPNYMVISLVFLSIYLNSAETVLALMLKTALLLSLPLLDTRLAYDPLLRVISFLWLSTLTVLVLRRYYQKAQLHNLALAQENELKYRMIFNSSLHVVMIHNGDDVLICNDAAAQLCGFRQAEELIGKRFRDFIHPDDLEMVSSRAQKRLAGKEAPERYTHRVLGVDGVVRWVDSHSRVIPFENGRATLATAVDITHRQIIEEYLFRRVALDKIITSASTEFLNAQLDEIDSAILHTLKAMGEFVDIDHAYVMQFEEYQGAPTFNCTHEWVREGITAQNMLYQKIEADVFPWGYQQLMKGKIVNVPNLDELPDSIPEKHWLRDSGLKAYIEVPMISQGQVLGLVGFDTVNKANVWDEDTIFLLRMMGEIFANAFERRRAEADLRQRNRELETLNALANIMTTTFDAEELLPRITQLFGEAFDMTSAYINNWDERNHTVKVLAEYMSPFASEAEKISDVGEVYHSDEWLTLIPNTYRESPIPHWLIHRHEHDEKTPFIRHMQKYGALTVLCLTMMIDDKRVGSLELWESRRPREFSSDELNLLQAMSNQASIMLDRAWVYSELRETEQQNRVILNALPDLIFRLGPDGRFLESKQNGLGQHPIEPRLFIHKFPQDIFAASIAQTLQKHLQAVLEDRGMQVFEYELAAENDSYHYEARLVKILSDQALMFVRDITPLKESAQRQVELSFEKERVRILENFISDASHDLRTPIANLKSRLYLLKRSDTPEKKARQIEVLEQEIVRLENLIEDLLTMSQLDGTLLGKTLVEIAVNYLIQEVAEANSLSASNKGLGFHSELAESLPSILGDPSEFSRMLSNLVSNAINYTPAGGRVVIRSFERAQRVWIEIQDTGMGIGEEDLPHIFERFYRADKARSTDRGGTGLGLAIAKKIIEIHRGEVQVESRVNEGTLFRLSFPRN